MVRKPTSYGKIKEKDQDDIFYWAFKKSAIQRLSESWRLHCANNNIPIDSKMNRSVNKAYLSNE